MNAETLERRIAKLEAQLEAQVATAEGLQQRLADAEKRGAQQKRNELIARVLRALGVERCTGCCGED